MVIMKNKLNYKSINCNYKQSSSLSLIMMMIITIMMMIINVNHVNGCWCRPETLPGYYCGDELDNCDANIVYECDDNDNDGLNFKFGRQIQQQQQQQQKQQHQRRQRLRKRPIRRQVDDCRQTSCIRSTDRNPASCWKKLTASIVVVTN